MRQAPRSSAIAHAIVGERVDWGPAEYLLALIGDALHSANWQRGGKAHAPKPKPIQRPGVKNADVTTYGSAPLPVDEMADWLGWTPGGAHG